jgi:hypothetical protein
MVGVEIAAVIGVDVAAPIATAPSRVTAQLPRWPLQPVA